MKRSWKIGLVSPYSNLSAIGLRYISASLRAADWKTRLVFLPDLEELRYSPKPHPPAYPQPVLDSVCALLADVDMVGITVMSNYYGRARSLTQAIQQALHVPVIWGGIHPTVMPEECLQWADFVCVGEGEEAIVELVHALETGSEPTGIANIWGKTSDGRLFSNPARPIYQDLDALPLPDYELDHQYILHNNELMPLTPSLLAHYLLNHFAGQTRVAYMLSTTRGCPYLCSFCCDSALAEMFPKWRQIRRRSPERIIAEIQMIRRIIPHLEAVMFIDSTFLAVRTPEIVQLAELYAQEISLPFFIMTTPGSIKEDKIKALVAAGLADVGMGIQSGSERTRAMYQRFETNEQILNAGQLLQKYQAQIPSPTYDLISDNPYETEDDKLATLQLLYKLPRPYLLHFFSLTFYPGTEMYRRAKADGLVVDNEADIYSKSYIQLGANYYNFVLWCLHKNLPKWLLWPLIQPFALKLFSRPVIAWPFRLALNIIYRQRVQQKEEQQLQRLPEFLSDRKLSFVPIGSILEIEPVVNET